MVEGTPLLREHTPKSVSRVRIPLSPPDKYLIARMSSLLRSIPWPNRGQIRGSACRVRVIYPRRRSISNTPETACSRWCARVGARCRKGSRRPSMRASRTCGASDTARGNASQDASSSVARFSTAIECRPTVRRWPGSRKSLCRRAACVRAEPQWRPRRDR